VGGVWVEVCLWLEEAFEMEGVWGVVLSLVVLWLFGALVHFVLLRLGFVLLRLGWYLDLEAAGLWCACLGGKKGGLHWGAYCGC
jgi:hypothetical protein